MCMSSLVCKKFKSHELFGNLLFYDFKSFPFKLSKGCKKFCLLLNTIHIVESSYGN